jgi:hypothetical protein
MRLPMTDTATVLKTDVLGRVKISKAHYEALLDAFEGSGLSGLRCQLATQQSGFRNMPSQPVGQHEIHL